MDKILGSMFIAGALMLLTQCAAAVGDWFDTDKRDLREENQHLEQKVEELRLQQEFYQRGVLDSNG